MANNNLVPGLPSNNLVSYKPMKQPKKLLCWSDSVLSSSGFGTVSKHILKALYDTGEYEIDQLAINHAATFYDKNETPYCIVPARLEKPDDLFGKQMFVNSLLKKEYDIVLVINDTYVVQEVAGHMTEIRKMKKTHGKKQFDLVYYFPVDHPGEVAHDSDMIDMADRTVAYNKFGAEAVEATGRQVTDIIPHGVDTRAFHPITPEDRRSFRKQTWHIDDDTFVFINVNRNTLRKDVAKTILAFSEFKKLVPKSMLYLNMRMVDGSSNYMLDLIACIEELGLDHKKDVIFPTKFNPMQGFPVYILNQFYSSADAYITTHLGEGWGLCLDSSTKLDTYRGAISIKDVLVGDEVVGQDGKFHRVLDKTNRTVDEIYSVKSMYSSEILVTPEHPFFVKPREETQPFWMNVKDIRPGDYLAIPKSTENEPLPQSIDITDYLDDIIESDGEYVWYKMGYSPKTNGLSIQDIQNKYKVSKRVAEDARRVCLETSLPSRGLPKSLAFGIAQDIKKQEQKVNTQQLKIKRHIPVTDEFLYFIGWYLSEGSNGAGAKIDIDLNIDEISFARQLGQYMSATFGVESIVEQNGLHKCRVRASGQVLAKAMGVICGSHAWNKRVPSFLLKSPRKLGPLLRALFLGDGHLDKQKRSHSLTTTSPSLAYQVRYICAANNILTTTSEYSARGTGKHSQFDCRIVTPHLERWATFINQSLELREIDRKPATHFIENDRYFFIKVKEISRKLTNNKEVYDICVEDTHSFVANGILVHNTVVEAMAAGCPVIAPNNTSMPEILGDNRGYMYECKEKTFIDSSGYRPVGRLDDILEQMMACYQDWKSNSTIRRSKIAHSRKWAEEHSWDIVTKSWVKLFSELKRHKEDPLASQMSVEVI